MAVHPIDQQILPATFASPEMTAIFDEKARLGRWLAFEAALAASQAELGVIPAAAAQTICRTARLDALSLEEIKEAYQESTNSLVPLLGVLRRHCGPEAADYVHYGATTQDVLDTAEVLAHRQALAIIYGDLRQLAERLAALAGRHRSTPMIGRTHGQHALPITLGLKLAGWLGECLRHLERCGRQARALRYGQLGGATGTLAALGPRAVEIAERTLQRLGLERPPLAWHNQRDGMAELAALYGLLLSFCEKIAGEVVQLSRPEIGELTEGGPRGVSSTMPHKNNPVASQRLAALARHGRALVPVVLEATAHEHERDARRLWSEWPAMAQLAVYAGTAVQRCVGLCDNLRIDTQRMLANLRASGEAMLAEYLVFALAERHGRLAAQRLVRQLLEERELTGQPLADLLAQRSEAQDLDPALLAHPEAYRGLAEQLVDDALAQAAAALAAAPAELFAPAGEER